MRSDDEDEGGSATRMASSADDANQKSSECQCYCQNLVLLLLLFAHYQYSTNRLSSPWLVFRSLFSSVSSSVPHRPLLVSSVLALSVATCCHTLALYPPFVGHARPQVPLPHPCRLSSLSVVSLLLTHPFLPLPLPKYCFPTAMPLPFMTTTSLRMAAEDPEGNTSGVERGVSVDQDGKSNVWAIEPQVSVSTKSSEENTQSALLAGGGLAAVAAAAGFILTNLPDPSQF